MNKINLWRNTKRVLLFALIGIMTLVTGAVNRNAIGEAYPFETQTRTVGRESADRSCGVTTDGAAWIFSGEKTLTRVTLDDRSILAYNEDAVPAVLKTRYGSTKLGGISFANDYVYAAVENSGDKDKSVVALFDAKTLGYADRSVQLPGASWVACDTWRGVFYVSQQENAEQLFVYDLETLAYVKTIALDKQIPNIRGAEMYNGRLYAATDDKNCAVYQISVETGEVSLYIKRCADKSGARSIKGKDLTVLPMNDGTVFHALDVGALSIDANLRHYVPRRPDLPAERPDTPVRPKVTYLDKYFIQILQSGSYTIQTEMQAEGVSVPMTTYSDADNLEIRINISATVADAIGLPISLGKLGEIRLVMTGINSDPHVYVAWTGGYVEVDSEDVGELNVLFENAENESNWLAAMQFENLVYVGLETEEGCLIETYTNPEDNTMYRFYFDSLGLAKWEIVDMSTNTLTETIYIRIKAGVTDRNAFKVSGKKYSVEELEQLIGA